MMRVTYLSDEDVAFEQRVKNEREAANREQRTTVAKGIHAFDEAIGEVPVDWPSRWEGLASDVQAAYEQRAAAAIDAMRSGPRRVWAVHQVYERSVGHGYEPVAFFSTEERADAYRDSCEQRQAQHFIDHAEYYKTSHRYVYEFDVEPWTVDDPDTLIDSQERTT